MFEIRMPKMGLTMTTGTVVKWHKKEGDPVKKGEEILDISTEKITNTVEAPADGVLIKIIAPEGTELPIGGLLGLIGSPGEKAGEEISGGIKEAGGGERIKITPAAAKLAREMGVDCTLLAGTGPGGRITREDVEKAAAQVRSVQAPSEGGDKKPVSGEFIPYTGMRKAIGDNMSRSWATAPKVTHHVSVDVSRLLELRKMINEDLDEMSRVSITDLLIKIAAKALEMKPSINVSLEGGSIKLFKDINIGVAVALENGLVVPVVKNAGKKSLLQVSAKVRELAQKARENRLSLEEMSGGTFTITNLGAYGSVDFFTPIINQPESAILGVGRVVQAPAVIEGQVVPRPMMGLSLAFDHRVIDGAPAAEFLAVLIKMIERPLAAIL
ncbi:MAG: dihydrolipoamide acetyltransferase family protein [Peptococcaceae bacterium]|jgi:pyruvate dehydrogenase E2 component (dihydrolipoamide acetyltransferase)|nr:2-oxo acid dehydrogenase subunit E2 [Peptococcaceae bacterium]MDH7524680.1 dihydrolipoamide acetyltransferase family protein [Peptococcaceae bacterium]